MNNKRDNNIQLTYVDRLILDSYCDMLDGLSHYLGDGYELVLHSLEDYNHSAIKVINGFHTGRKEGAPITDLALIMLEKIQNQSDSCKDITYFVKNKKGEPLKSATITVKGENDRIIGLLCINFYMNTPMAEFFKNFTFEELPAPESRPSASQKENFSSSSTELVEKLVEQIQAEVMADSKITFSNKNKEIIQRLYQKGVYNLKDSVIKTAQILNISKNTVYLHLRNIDRANDQNAPKAEDQPLKE